MPKLLRKERVSSKVLVRIHCSNPQLLLKKIKAKSTQKKPLGKIKTWKYEDGIFEYDAKQYKDKARIAIRIINKLIVVKLTWLEESEPSQLVKGIFIGRFIQMFLGHFTRHDFDHFYVKPFDFS